MVKREGKKGHHCLFLLEKVKTSERYPLFLTVGSATMSLVRKVFDHYVKLPKLLSNSFFSSNQNSLQHIMLININPLYNFYFVMICKLKFACFSNHFHGTLWISPHWPFILPVAAICLCQIHTVYCLLTISLVLEKIQESS